MGTKIVRNRIISALMNRRIGVLKWRSLHKNIPEQCHSHSPSMLAVRALSCPNGWHRWLARSLLYYPEFLYCGHVRSRFFVGFPYLGPWVKFRGGGRGYSLKFRTGVCRWVPETLGLFQRGKNEFATLFQTNFAKIGTLFQSDCQGMWPLIRHFSHLFKAKQNFLISQICKPKWTVSGEISILKAKSSLKPGSHLCDKHKHKHKNNRVGTGMK